jgi:archaellum biogenesis ATPase FlaH
MKVAASIMVRLEQLLAKINRDAIRQGNCRAFGVPILDTLIPEGLPVPCTLLIAADVGTQSEFLSNEILRNHLASNPKAKVLWFSLENFVGDLRARMDNSIMMSENQLEFIDCYSSQIGVNSAERYSADPSNLPYLGMVTSTAISEMKDNCSLLVILDSLTSLVQKVGLRCSTEFFKWLIARARVIRADILTTLNRCAFNERTLATYIDIADAVLELTMDDEHSTNKIRIRKAQDVKHIRSWLPYEIDFYRRLLRFDIVKTIGIE